MRRGAIAAMAIFLAAAPCHAGMDFRFTRKGRMLKETKADYIRYVRYLKDHGLYAIYDPRQMESLSDLGKRYGIHPDSIAPTLDRIAELEEEYAKADAEIMEKYASGNYTEAEIDRLRGKAYPLASELAELRRRSSSPIRLMGSRELGKVIRSRADMVAMVDFMVGRGILPMLSYPQYQRLKKFAAKRHVFLPSEIKDSGGVPYHDTVRRVTPHAYMLFGFRQPKNEREELNILESRYFDIAVKRMRQRSHPDMGAGKSAADRLVMDFWWRLAESAYERLKGRREILQAKETLDEDSVMMPRSASDMVFREEAGYSGKLIGHSGLAGAVSSPIGAEISAYSIPLSRETKGGGDEGE